MRINVLLGLLAATGASALLQHDASIDPDNSEPTIWALLVAGSNGYYNYRHQADVCHAYQILHGNGIPDKNIIVMMYDDIANNEDNPSPGTIINYPGGPDVYKDVPKDYTGDDVSPENFLNILSGNKSALNGIGSGRVIESGPNDVLFVNFVDHGGPGILCFPNEDLHADRLIKTISELVSAKRFSKLFFYVEACESGSMFDNLLADNTNVLVLTAADPFESSYACYYDDKRETYLGDVFSVVWMNDTQYESLPTDNVHHQFERVRTFTNTSHVEEYGDLDIGVTKLKDLLGYRKKIGIPETSPPPIQDVADNAEISLIMLGKKLEKEQDPVKRKVLTSKKQDLITKRTVVDQIFKEIVFQSSDGNSEKMNELRSAKYGLNWGNIECYKELYETFNNVCMDIPKNPYVRTQFRNLVNMCSVSWLTASKSVEAINASCKGRSTLTKEMRGVY